MKSRTSTGWELMLLLVFILLLLIAAGCFILGLILNLSRVLLYVAFVLAAVSGLGLVLLMWSVRLSMSPSQRAGWKALKQARKAFKTWTRSQGIALERIEHLATFEEWSKSTGIVIFFKTDSELQRLKTDGSLQRIQTWYCQRLAQAHYPTEKWPVHFEFDSHENVLINFKGNYFLRMRK